VKIAIGCDHRGFAHKTAIIADLAEQGHQLLDCGCPSTGSADYSDPALAVGKYVNSSAVERGVLICGSGIGVSIAANKVGGVRASLCFDMEAARMTRMHNDSNVICMSGDRVDPALAVEMVREWLTTEFEGGRHERRIQKIKDYEARHFQK